MVIFYGRWLKNTPKGVEQTQIIVQDNRESEGKITVTTVNGGDYLTRGVYTELEAMTLVANICERLGGAE